MKLLVAMSVLLGFSSSVLAAGDGSDIIFNARTDQISVVGSDQDLGGQSEDSSDAQVPLKGVHYQGAVVVGTVYQNATGGSLVVSGSVRRTSTNEGGESNGQSAAVGMAVLGTIGGVGQLPNLHIEGRQFWGNEVPALGERTAISIFVGGAFDRNVPLGRLWDGRAFAGVRAMRNGPTSHGNRTLALSAQGELGVGRTGKFIVLPYVQARASVVYEECLQVRRDSERHQICSILAASVALGLVQLGLDASATAEYRYRIENDRGKVRMVLFTGPTASTSLLLDLNRGHAAGAIGLGAGVRFQ